MLVGEALGRSQREIGAVGDLDRSHAVVIAVGVRSEPVDERIAGASTEG